MKNFDSNKDFKDLNRNFKLTIVKLGKDGLAVNIINVLAENKNELSTLLDLIGDEYIIYSIEAENNFVKAKDFISELRNEQGNDDLHFGLDQ